MSASSPSTHATTSRMPTEPPPALTTAPPLPAPATFDVSPHIYALLTRILPPQPGENVNGTAGDGHEQNQPLEIQHLSGAAASVKVRIQKARQSVKALPDMERTTEEQEEELRDLEEHVQRLRDVLRGLSRQEDVKMEG